MKKIGFVFSLLACIFIGSCGNRAARGNASALDSISVADSVAAAEAERAFRADSLPADRLRVE